MKALIWVRGTLVRALESFVVLAFGFLIITVLWGVFTRFVLGRQAAWTEEAAIYLLIWVSMLGAALIYQDKGHLGVDYLMTKLHPSARLIAEVAVQVVVFAFSGVVLVMGGWVLVTETLSQGQLSPTLGLRVGFLYLAMPLSGSFFCLFSLEEGIRLVATAVGSGEERA
ncbi:MAG: hypothetical protein RL648_1309 [Verrucomicrobiota bacterium]